MTTCQGDYKYCSTRIICIEVMVHENDSYISNELKYAFEGDLWSDMCHNVQPSRGIITIILQPSIMTEII